MKKTLPAILLILLSFFAGTASGVFLEDRNNLITLRSENEPVSKILETLSRRYSIEIDYGNTLLNKFVSITIQKQPLERIISRLLQMTDVRNFVIYYNHRGIISKISFLESDIAKTEKRHRMINRRTYRKNRLERLPPLTPPNLPEPPDEIEDDITQSSKAPYDFKTEKIPTTKSPPFVPPRRTTRE